MTTVLSSPPSKTDRARLLHGIGRNYVVRGLGGKNFDAIPYAENVELRAPFCPGGVYQPLVGRAALRDTWWPPLPQLVAGVDVVDTFVNERLTAVTVEFHCHLSKPACTLRVVDRFTVNDDGLIVSQENFFDPREVTNPAWRKGGASSTLHHLAIAVSDFSRSKAFYDAVLGGLGYTLALEAEGFAGYAKDGMLFALRQAAAGTHHVHGGCGLHHLAFAAPSRAAVDHFYRDVLLKLPSVEIEDPPVECPEIMPGFYATFFYDLDGIKLEVTHTP